MPNKAKRLILVVLASALSCAVFAQKLTGVQWKKVGEGIELQIQGTDLAKPKATWTSSERSYVLEFDAKFSGRTGTKKINSAGVRYVTYGRYSSRPPKSRVHVRVNAGTKPDLFQTDSGWTIAFGETGTGSKAMAKAETFPNAVPPIEKPALNRVIEKMAASPVKALPSTIGVGVLERKVSLIFEGTEVIQILKALALQADVNIVTAPEVTGKLTVALNDVNVQQALDFITTMAGVRYALVGNTFVVATNERFANAMRQITNGQETSSQTRIIGLESGEGVQIKATVLKAVPQESIHGRYDMLLPTEMLTLETKMSASATGANIPKPAGGASGTGPGEAIKTDISAKAESGGNTVRPKDMYVVLVGLPQRLDEVERVVREVDGRLAAQGRVDIGKDIDTAVVPVFSGRVGEVAGALRRVIDRDAKRELYSIHESDSSGGNPKEDSIKLLVISGPRDSMKSVEAFAKGIDEGLCKSMGIAFPESQEDQARGFEVFDLKYVEPLEAATELEKHVPGIKASVLPSAARPNPRGSRTVSAGNAEGGSSSTGNAPPATGGLVNPSLGVQGGGANSAPNNSNAGASQGSGSGEDGFNLTKNMGAEPMKILVRGNRGQMEQARQFLSVFDLAPKQVALELRVMELTKEEALKVGLDWSALTGGTVRFIRFNNGINPSASTPGTISSGNPSSNLAADQGLSFGNGGFGSVTATLDQLAGSLKMVARPNIIASEGRPTTIFVGDEVRYVESIVASQNGIIVTTGQVNVGVKLNVTPRVGADGNLLLDLNPELSLLRGFTDVPGGGQLPQTSLRSTTSMVNLKSGETLAIGGLIQESDRKTVSGVPILMNLPIIGHFFKRTNTSKVRSEVVFFLTATEVGSGNRGSAADPRASESKNKAEIDKKNGGKG